MKKITEFISKDGRKIDIVLPEASFLKQITEFVNLLGAEDTYLSFTPENPLTLKHEKEWLKNTLVDIKRENLYVIWAVYNNKIIGASDVRRNPARSLHIGTIGLMVDQNFRGIGLGKFLLEFILKKAPTMNFSIVTLDVFDDNEIAKRLYEKFGFKQWGRLPNGFYRKEKYSDHIKMYKDLSSAKATDEK